MSSPPAATLPGTADTRAAARRLRDLGRVAAPRLRLAGVFTMLAGWLLVPQAAAIAWCAQQVLVEHAPVEHVRGALAVLLAAALARSVLHWLAREQSDAAVETIRQQLRGDIVRGLAARGPLWLRGQRSGALAELPMAHVDALEGYFGGYVPTRLEVAAVPPALLAALFWAEPVVGALVLSTLPLIPLFMALVGWNAEAASRAQLQALTRMGGHFADRLRGLGLIRLYGRGEAELAGVAAAAEVLRERSLKVLRVAFLSSAVLEFFASVAVALVALYLGLSYLGMLDLRRAPLDLFTGLFCLLLVPECHAPLRRLAAHYHDRAGALAAVGEIDRALAPAPAAAARAPAITPDVAPPTLRPLSPYRVQASNLQLRPVGAPRPVLRHLSLRLVAGEHLAVTGPSGCGKSTLLEALAGWLPPEAGTLRIPEPARIGYAPQRPHLFAGSIADNLRLARPRATDAQVQAAAEAAQVMRFAARLPRGLDTPVGERGFGLSGGEARRIALARVFLRAPDLLLLDEPTAFLDADTEAALLAALAEFARGRTLVMATHSAAAMRSCRQVLALPPAAARPTGDTA